MFGLDKIELLFLVAMLSLAVAGGYVSAPSYRRGQRDAANGIWKYGYEWHEDGTCTWEKLDEPNTCHPPNTIVCYDCGFMRGDDTVESLTTENTDAED